MLICNLFQGLSYDLGDCTKWEYMFPSIDKPLKIPGEDGFEDFEDEEVLWIFRLQAKEIPKHFKPFIRLSILPSVISSETIIFMNNLNRF